MTELDDEDILREKTSESPFNEAYFADEIL